jgi:hypothetical protein
MFGTYHPIEVITLQGKECTGWIFSFVSQPGSIRARIVTTTWGVTGW